MTIRNKILSAVLASAAVAFVLTGCSPTANNPEFTAPSPEVSDSPSATPSPEEVPATTPDRPETVPADAQAVSGVEDIAWYFQVTDFKGQNDVTVNGQNIHCDDDVAGNKPSGADVYWAEDGSISSIACAVTFAGEVETTEGW